MHAAPARLCRGCRRCPATFASLLRDFPQEFQPLGKKPTIAVLATARLMARITWQLLDAASGLHERSLRTNTSEASLLSGLPGWRAWPRKCRNRSKILPIPPKKTFPSRSKIILVGREAERFDDAPLIRAGDLIIIMNVGQHSPPRRELWSYHHPSFKTIPPKEGFVSSNSQVSTRRPILRQFRNLTF